jgi:hypothetical protein
MVITMYEGVHNKKERALIDEITDFVADRMFPRHVLEITYRIIPNLETKEGIQGDTIWEDSQYRPRDFCVRLNKGYKTKDLITLIIHELIHVKQFLRGELKHEWVPSKGIYREIFKGKDTTNFKYMNKPSEKEAYKLQEVLYNEFINR